MASIKQDLQETFLGLYETAQEKWSDFTQFLLEAWPLLVALLIILLGVWWYADPPPPRHVMMATGAPGSSYHELGKKYADFFAKKGIILELVQTEGAQEDMTRLANRQDPIQAAFVQAGVDIPQGVSGIESLGAIDYEPIWFFYRGPELKGHDFQAYKAEFKQFYNAKISMGAIGSGTYVQASKILGVNGLGEGPKFVHLSLTQSVSALKEGQIDGAFIVDAYEGPSVQALLEDPSIRLVSFPRAEAYARLLPYLQILHVPTGAFSLVRNFPDYDMRLMSTTTNLLIDNRMHPAIQFLFLEAAREINGKSTFFAKRDKFPSFDNPIFPESAVALHFEKNGSPLLMAYLPFWVAELINRLAFVLLPFLAIAYPVLLTLPGYRDKRIRSKINKLYVMLKGYEQELTDSAGPVSQEIYLQKLDLLEYEALKLNIPKGVSGDYYALRTSIDYVRNCLNRGVHPYQLRDQNISA
ncbi:TAXI family TRAP transporter solute-binding subunit [Polynucleobacter brandtiae]|uniref:TRAP-type uncharacterized transport system substrate-binding protein n=1 Tax=Polynucleobacter brandtiae TaxID=1938816 RepID=A0A2M8VIS6_9BURK|nr:TAXI family TRAP transporter solute-binding subunit [Polynucleobacter brandtiae]PJI76753.1 TRAP-type uncharacterized transport system substrate-binding protein [Polynucleobacter brandtiae]